MHPAPRSPKHDSSSEGDSLGPRPPRTNKHAKARNRKALIRPPLGTRSPFPLQSDPPSSCSSTDSIFSNSAVSSKVGTPLTPPSNTPAAIDSKNSLFANDGKTSKMPFIDRLKEDIYSAAPDTPVTSPISKSSAHQAPDKDMEGLSIRGDDDELSAHMSSLSLGESSPTPQERAGMRKGDRQFPREIDECSNNPRDSDKSGLKAQVRQATIANTNLIKDDGPSVTKPASVRSKSMRPSTRGRGRPSSNNRGNSNAPSTIVISSDETREEVAREFSTPAQPVPASDENTRLQPTQSRNKSSHTRSKSATPQLPEASISGEIRDRNSPAKSKEASGTLSVPAPNSKRRVYPGKSGSTAKSKKTRPRSTGAALEEPGSSSQSVEPTNSGGEKQTDDATGVKNGKDSRVAEKMSSRLDHETTESMEPDEQPGFPKLEAYNLDFKNEKDLKLEILEAIRAKSPSKRAKSLRESIRNWWNKPAEVSGYIYIFRSRPNAFPGRSYVKIGMTKRKPGERIKEWEHKCGFEFIHIQDDNDKPFFHFAKAEKIIEAVLYNERRKYKCNKCSRHHQLELGEHGTQGGPTEHGEWYEIPEEKALEVVNKWRKWIIESRPYKKTGTLRVCWLWKFKEAANTADFDWNIWFDFTKREQFQCALDCVDSWASEFLPILVKTMRLLLCPTSVFGLGLMYPFFIYGAGLKACFASSGILLLYLLYYFKYSEAAG